MRAEPLVGAARGFTLIELLVVIAIIAILGSLLLPALGAGKVRAQQASCRSNMRQLGICMRMYCDDHAGMLPLTTHGHSAAESWVNTLKPYAGNVESIRLCPADAKVAERLSQGGTSYIQNEFLAVPLRSPFGGLIDPVHRLDSLPRPAEAMMLFETAERYGPGVYADHTHSRGWVLGWQAVLADIQPDRHRTGAPAEDHTRGSANYLYADGHVEGIKAALLKAQIDQGINPADPNPARRYQAMK